MGTQRMDSRYPTEQSNKGKERVHSGWIVVTKSDILYVGEETRTKDVMGGA